MLVSCSHIFDPVVIVVVDVDLIHEVNVKLCWSEKVGVNNYIILIYYLLALRTISCGVIARYSSPSGAHIASSNI